MRQAILDPSGPVRVPEDPGARVAFSDRSVGNVSLRVGGGDVAAARRRLVGLVGLAPDRAVFMDQAHDARVAVVGAADRGRGLARADDAVPAVDALVTRDVDVALVVQVADCVPVLLVDPGTAVAAVHAGRRGIAAGVVGAAVEVLDADPSRLVALLGPAIGGCCYEVPAELADALTETVPAARAVTRWGTPSLDLPAAVVHQLAAAGVGSVRRTGSCTRCHSDRWFSHRADTSGASDTSAVPAAPAAPGRQAGVVCRRGASDSPSSLPGSGGRFA